MIRGVARSFRCQESERALAAFAGRRALGPLSQLGALVARVAKRTLDAGMRGWMEEHA